MSAIDIKRLVGFQQRESANVRRSIVALIRESLDIFVFGDVVVLFKQCTSKNRLLPPPPSTTRILIYLNDLTRCIV